MTTSPALTVGGALATSMSNRGPVLGDILGPKRGPVLGDILGPN